MNVGDDTYGTLAEAATYFATRFGESNFTTLATDTLKENALLMATVLLDSYCTWQGNVTDLEQKLQFPRNGETVVPAAIKKAQFEIAESIVAQGGGTAEDSTAIKNMKIDVISFEWWNTSNTTTDLYFNKLARTYLEPYCDNNNISGSSVIRV